MAVLTTTPKPPRPRAILQNELEHIISLIHEETNRPHPQTKLATGAMLAKLEYLFNELEKTKKEME